MRILILAQVFPPERHPTAIMVQQLSRHLAGQGHEVAVATGLPNHPFPAEFREWPVSPVMRERHEGVTVLRAWHPRPSGRGVLSRATGLAAHLAAAMVASSRFRDPDVVICFGYPLIGPALASLRTALSRGHLVTVIYDIYPDVATESGTLTNPFVVRGLQILERFTYSASTRVVVLSEGFRKTLRSRGVPEDKIVVIPVWLAADEIVPQPRDNAWRAEQSISTSMTVVLYAGTIGIVSGARVLIDAAMRLRDRQDLLFLLVGDGESRDSLALTVREEGLENVRLLPFQPRDRIAEIQATSDISVVTLAPGRGRTSVPSKVVAYLAAGRPVVASVDRDSDTATCVERSGGVVVAAGDADSLASAIAQLADDPEERGKSGRAARARFEAKYSASQGLANFASLIAGLDAPASEDSQ